MASRAKRRRANRKPQDPPGQGPGIWQRGRWWLIGGGVVGVVALLLVVLSSSLSGTETTGGELPASSLDISSTGAPDFPVVFYQGEELLGSPEPRLTSFFGSKPVVMNYWASNCPPCRAEMPGFERVWRRFKDRVLFVGLDVGRFIPGYGDQGQSKKELKELGITYVAASPESIEGAYALQVRGFPSTDFFTPDGTLYKRWDGALGESKLTELVEDLMNKGGATASSIGEAVPTLAAGHGPPYSYNTRPPTSGRHQAAAAPYGLSSTLLEAPAVVHNMEHGAVVVWYQPGDTELAGQIGSLAAELGSECLVVGPYSDMDYAVAATAWGRLLGIDAFDADSITGFVSAYRGALGPEAGVCFGES